MSRTLGATAPPLVARLHGAHGGLARRAAVVLAGALGLLGGASAVRPAPTAAAPALPGLPSPGALTMGAEAGQTLVGVTLTPGAPGPNLVTVYLEGVQGPAASAGLQATISDGSLTRILSGCGATCRQATLSLHSGDDLDVEVLGATGGRASFTVPPLPAPSGSALLEQTQLQMHRLRTYTDLDTLTGGIGPAVVTDYTAQAPDRAEWTVDGQQTIWIGTTQYARAGPGLPWSATPGLEAAHFPWFVWDPFPPLADAHIVGHGVVDGTPTTDISFMGTDPGLPIWFELRINPQDLVVQESMMAPGHFMHDTFSDFDRPISIVEPAVAATAPAGSGGAPSGSIQGSGPGG